MGGAGLGGFSAPGADGGADIGGERAVGGSGWRLGRLGCWGARARGARREGDFGDRVEAEHAGERAQEAAGAGDFAQEGCAFRGGEEVLKLGATAGGGVADLGDEPGSGGGQAGGGAGAGFAAGVGRAQGRQGAGLPVGDESGEALGGAADVGAGEVEERGLGGVTVDVGGHRDPEGG